MYFRNNPQMLSVFNNRIVKAVWLMVLIGILTAAKPFFPGSAGFIFSLGLSAPEIIMSFIKGDIYVVLSSVFALFFIIPAVMVMIGKTSMLRAGALVLFADLILIGLNVYINKPYSDEIFPIIIAVALRVMSLSTVFRGYLADGHRSRLLENIKEADRKYDEECETGKIYCENEDPEIKDEPAEDTKPEIYCTNCGAKAEMDSNFCDQCGTKL
ncbi:MAG: zinc-ribbon domain-containing protein [Clostridiaceae bacterium]